MVGYEFAELLEDGRRVGPSHGNWMPGPYIPSPCDRCEESIYKVRGWKRGSAYPTTVVEARCRRGRWMMRRRAFLSDKMLPWVWEDTLAQDGECADVATRVYGGAKIVVE